MSAVESAAIPRLGLASAGLSMTAEEFDAALDYDGNYNYELIHGVLVVSPLAGEMERAPNEILGYLLNRYRFEHPSGNALIDTVFEQYLKTAGNRRRADRVVWTMIGNERPDPRTDFPSIAIEFVSSGKAAWRRDYVEKRDEYLSGGILEYWVIDRFRRCLTAYSKRGEKIVERVVNEGEIHHSDLLPGFELPLAELLAAADRWNAEPA